MCHLLPLNWKTLSYFRYKPVGQIATPRDARTTLDEGGNCHMGRGTELHPTIVKTVFQSNVCRKVHSNFTYTVVRCKHPNGTAYDLEMKKEMSKAPDWMVAAMKSERRQRCKADCSAPPKWKTEFSNKELPQGPEVSYGIPFRWSAARLLAADMRAMVCGSRHNQSDECNALIASQHWTPEIFATKYFSEEMPDLVSPQLLRMSSSWGQNQTSSILQAIRDAAASFVAGDDAEDMYLWSGKEAPGINHVFEMLFCWQTLCFFHLRETK